MSIDRVLAEIDRDLDNSLERLFGLLRIESISTDPAYKQECLRAANWLREELGALDFDARVHPTRGHPMVVAHAKAKNGAKGPHVLFYGHYDVQPADPLELWKTRPFEPSIVEAGGKKTIVARGSADDKGQLMTFLEACRAFNRVDGGLPVPVTILFEGEEETGSPSLKPFLDAHKDELKADLALICDTDMWDERTPAVTTMLRGLVLEEVTITGADRDLHSGLFGGAAINPIRVLTKILGDIHDGSGRITVPGFYDGVSELDPEIAARELMLGRGPLPAMEGAGIRSGQVFRRTWSQAAGRRKGQASARTDLGKADLRRERHLRRLYGRGVEDRDTREGDRESLLPARRRTKSCKSARCVPRIRARAPARRLQGGFHFAWCQPRVAASAELTFAGQGARGSLRRMGTPRRPERLRRIDPDRGRVQARSRDGFAADRLRAG